MSNINAPIEWNNQNETINSQNWNQINTKKIFNDYIENRINWNPSFFSVWLDYNDFLDFIKISVHKSNYENFKKNKDTYINSLAKEIIVYNTKYKNIYDNTFKSFEWDFDLLEWNFDRLKDILKSLDNNSLKKLLYSNKKRLEFLKNNLWLKDDEIVIKDDEKRLEKILPKTFDEIKDNKEAISSILTFIDRKTKVEIYNLENILNILTTSKQKIEFISYFLPSISLKEALSLWFISWNELKKRKENIIKKIYSKENYDDEFIKNIVSSIDDNDIYIETSSIDNNNFEITITPAVLKKISDEINDTKEQLSQETKEINTYELDEFISLLKKDNSLSDVIYNLENIKNWNFFKIVSSTWQNPILEYFRFDEVKSWTQTSSMEFTNITLGTWVNTNLKDSSRKETKTYSWMYELFKKLKSKSANIVFMSKSDLEKDLQKEWKTEVPDETNINSKEDLKKFFDEIDPKWKDLWADNIAFKFDIIWDNWRKTWKEELYIIEEINETTKTITLHSWEKLWFDRFAELFKQAKAKRIQKLSTPKEFIEKLSWTNENFKNIIFKNNKIIPRDKENDNKFKSIQYFISEKWNESIYVKDLWDNRVDFIIWKYSEWVKWKDGKIWKDTFKWESKWTWWSYTEFFDLIKDKKLSPKIFDNETNNDEWKVKDVPWQKWNFLSLWSWWFISISNIVDWFKWVIDSVEKRLEQWDKLKSQRATMAFAKFLPKSLQDEIQSRIEREEKSTMEELKETLTTLDSKKMIPRIEAILLNKNAPMYEKEARMFACLKYGNIYPKELKKYRWSYAWFKAMWWDIRNIDYYEKELKKYDPNLVVTEEDLIAYLLKLQANWDYPPKRRSKIHKDFAGAIWWWISDEKDDWEKETSKKMTLDWRINYVMWEINNGTYYNGIWWIEEIFKKWPDPAYKIFEVPFVLLSTKTTLNLNQSIITKLVWHGFSTAHTPLFFSKSDWDLNMYKNYIKRVIELKFPEMLWDFKKIWNDTKKAQEFWNKYWSELYPYINMNNSFVLSRKDEPWNEVLKSYYEKIKWVHQSSDFKIGKLSDDIRVWAFDFENSPIFATKWLLDRIEARDWWVITDEVRSILVTYWKYIQSIPNDETIQNDEKRKELFKEFYKSLERKVYFTIAPFRKWNTDPFWYKNTTIFRTIKEYWIDLYDWEDWRWYEDFLDIKYRDFMSWQHIEDDIWLISGETNRKIDDILN